jgi:CubicO group peptidase (beta-lactamase class C family)
MLTRRGFAAAPALAAAAALPAHATPRGAGLTRSFDPRAVAETSRLMQVAQVPCLTYALIEAGRLTQTAALGLRRSGGEPVTSRTFFDAASLTKPVFATVALGLAAEGRLDLDRPLQAYLPMFADPLTQKITARHVLSHSTGLPNWHYSAEPLKSAFVPGSRWAYSGEAMFYLARVAELVSNRPLPELVQAYALTPAGMSESSFVWSEAVAADHANPHDVFGDIVDDKFTQEAFSVSELPYVASSGKPMSAWSTDDALKAAVAAGRKPYPGNTVPNPAYGLWTTAADYARFLIFAAGQSARSEPQVRIRGDLAWGLGWGLELGSDGPFAWHWGDAGGVKNLFMLHLPTRSGLVVLTGSDAGPRIYRRLTRRTNRREFDTFLMI